MSVAVSLSEVEDTLGKEIGWYGFRAGHAAVCEVLENDISWQTLIDLHKQVFGTAEVEIGDPCATAIDVLAEFGLTDECDERYYPAAEWFFSGFHEGATEAVCAAVAETFPD